MSFSRTSLSQVTVYSSSLCSPVSSSQLANKEYVKSKGESIMVAALASLNAAKNPNQSRSLAYHVYITHICESRLESIFFRSGLRNLDRKVDSCK